MKPTVRVITVKKHPDIKSRTWRFPGEEYDTKESDGKFLVRVGWVKLKPAPKVEAPKPPVENRGRYYKRRDVVAEG